MNAKIFLLAFLIASISSKQFPSDLETIEDSEILLGASNDNEKSKTIKSCALNKIESPYSYGQAGPDSFDCSGLAYYCHSLAKIAIEREAQAQAKGGKIVDIKKLKAGDLVFFDLDIDGSVDHVGIYIKKNL